jgi:hypothetical protein
VLHEVGMIGMIVNDCHNVGWKFARTPATKQIKETMRLLACQYCDSRKMVGESQLRIHRKFVGYRSEGMKNFVTVKRETIELKFDALEENSLNIVGVLFGMNNVSTVSGNEFCDCSYDPTLIGARK